MSVTSTGFCSRIGLWLTDLRYVPRVRDPDASTRGLVAPHPAVTAGAGGAPPGFRVVDTYVAVPDLGHPQALLPADSAGAAARALRRFAQGSGAPARLAALAAAGGLRAGGLRLIRRNRVTVSVAQGLSDDRLPELVLRRHLERRLGRDGLQLAIRVGAARPNGKPVVQVLDAAGEAVGFCKIGWNDLTRPLVAGEADALQELAAVPAPLSFSVPGLLERGNWQGFELLVVEAIAERGQPTGTDPPVRATGEVAGLGGRTRERLTESRWWADLQTRLAAIDHPRLVTDAGRLGERFGRKRSRSEAATATGRRGTCPVSAAGWWCGTGSASGTPRRSGRTSRTTRSWCRCDGAKSRRSRRPGGCWRPPPPVWTRSAQTASRRSWC